MLSRRLLQRCLNHFDQRLGWHKRLLKHAVGANALRLVFVEGVKSTDQQYDGDVRKSRIALHILADLIAAAHGHENVGQDQIGGEIREFANCGFAVAD